MAKVFSVLNENVFIVDGDQHFDVCSVSDSVCCQFFALLRRNLVCSARKADRIPLSLSGAQTLVHRGFDRINLFLASETRGGHV
jgi:hypothetical protein